ncbi:MAG: acyl-CoA thioesterase [Gemmobacter sp.]
MYPVLRFATSLWQARRLPPLPITGVHRSVHRIWPWDLDPWAELNNGRTLTLYDLGRIPLFARIGVDRVLAARGWGVTVAGVSVRYRRRLVLMQRVEMVSRLAGWDGRFFYIDQSLWSGGECANQMLLRSAVFGGGEGRGRGAGGILPAPEVAAACGHSGPSPELPPWITAWIAAEGARPWPPEPHPEA